MRRLTCAILPLAAALLLHGAAWAAGQLDLDVSATLGGHLHETTPRTTLRGGQLHAKYAYDGEAFGVRGEGRVRWNDAYDNPAYSREARDAYRLSADWRELYIQANAGEWNISAGLQQVVWGKADSLRIVDVVNPVDLREFVLPDLNDYRKPVMMLRGTRPLGDWNIELLYLPWFTPTGFAHAGSEFYLPLVDARALQQFVLLPENRPARTLSNGEAGMHLSRSFAGLDVSAFLFYTRSDDPVFRQTVATDTSGSSTPALQAEYRRQLLIGLALARSLGNALVLRSELAFVPNATYMSATGAGGLETSRTLTGLLGLDYVWRDWMITFQATDRHIADWRPDYMVKRRLPLYTFSVTGNTLGGRLESRFAVARYGNSQDGTLWQVKATWKADDRWSYTLGADVLSGEPDGVFGQFRDKSRAYTSVQYRF